MSALPASASDSTGMPLTGKTLPGFDATQSYVIESMADKIAAKIIEQLRTTDCSVPCTRMDAVEVAVFGRAEAGVIGLCERMHISESRWSTTRRFVWTALGVFLTGCGSVIVLTVTKHL